ncbi:hypothetical protein CEXT_291471 [Caerostris extrusa]|uniref:Uncharacterized protein n=1 Tax=Caerostris extrusa TaxID=172846 RepID=A0AAV4Y180_CAEEX|nr:hypothetical protein CEXT_291471 [Caerostris extrusa]
MDETRCVSLIFFLVGLGLLAQYLYLHTFWSLFHLLFYTLLMTVTVKENGGLKALISALDRWAAEVVTHRNDELFAGSVNVRNKAIIYYVTSLTKTC